VGVTIGDRIKAAREAAGLTQQQLSDAVSSGGGRQQVSNWEGGRRTPRRETLERIAEVLGVKAGWLMFGA
jgi:transcriptional regulator with XRE-family HTH domain